MEARFPTQCTHSGDDQEQPWSIQGDVACALSHSNTQSGGHGVAAQEPQKQERMPRAPVPAPVPAPLNEPRDNIVITANSGAKIEAEGLAAVLQPGGIFQVGMESQRDIYHMPPSHKRKAGKRKNKYKLTESPAEPDIRHLDVLSALLAEDAYPLGRRLGLADPVMDRMKLDYYADGQHEINYRILASWKQQAGPEATLQKLARALVDVGRGDLADELRKG